MIKYAVRYLKNAFIPIKDIPQDCGDLNGKLVLLRTEKGEEVLKAFIVSKPIADLFTKCPKTPQAFSFIRVMSQEDMMIYEELKKEEGSAFIKCQELIKKHNLTMNLVRCNITFDKRKISFYSGAKFQ